MRKKLIRVLSILAAIEIVTMGWLCLNIIHVKDYNRQITLGDKYLEELDYENAELCYNKAIHIDEKQAKPYLQLAVLYHDTDRPEEALDILEQGEKNKAYSETEEKSVEEIRETINSGGNKEGDEENSKEENSEKEDEQAKVPDRDEYLKQYQVILDEYNRAKEYDEEYVYQHKDEFPNMDDGFINYLSDVRYCLYDIDENGIDELLLFRRYETENGHTDSVFDMYSYNGETAEKLFFKGEWDSAWHCPVKIYTDGTIYIFSTAGSTRAGSIDFYKLAEDGYTPILTESYEVDQTHLDAPYFNDKEALTEEEFQAKLATYTEIVLDDCISLSTPLYTTKDKNEADKEKIYVEYAEVAKRCEDAAIGNEGVSEYRAGETLFGLSFLQLFDFNNDGVEELVICYCIADPTWTGSGINPQYCLEVWGYQNEKVQQLYQTKPLDIYDPWEYASTLPEGYSVTYVTYQGKKYLKTGNSHTGDVENSGNAQYIGFSDDGKFTVLQSTEYVYYAQTNMHNKWTVNGQDVTEEQWKQEEESWSADIVSYCLKPEASGGDETKINAILKDTKEKIGYKE